jgi:hypothetical protein
MERGAGRGAERNSQEAYLYGKGRKKEITDNTEGRFFAAVAVVRAVAVAMGVAVAPSVATYQWQWHWQW